MGHNLNVANGKVSMMYVGEVPWHELGTKLDSPATAAEAIAAAGLAFTVEKMLLKTRTLDLPVEGHYAMVRTDTHDVLGVVGGGYVPIQNRDAFTMFDALVGEGEAIYHTAGALGKGERIWILAKLPEYIRVNGNDIVEKFLLLTNSHDGSGAVRAKLTPIRVVCQNTLAIALSGFEQEVRICHVGNAEEKLKKAHEILGLTNKLYAELDQVFNRLSDTKLTGTMLTDFVQSVFPLQPTTNTNGNGRGTHVHDKVLQLVEEGEGAELARGTLWGAYNAVTEYVDHCRIANATDSMRLKSMWFGSGERIKKKAFIVARGLIGLGRPMLN